MITLEVTGGTVDGDACLVVTSKLVKTSVVEASIVVISEVVGFEVATEDKVDKLLAIFEV